MAGYTKEFLIDAYMYRFNDNDRTTQLREISERHYDKVGKDQFRITASLDAEALRKYKLVLVSK